MYEAQRYQELQEELLRKDALLEERSRRMQEQRESEMESVKEAAKHDLEAVKSEQAALRGYVDYVKERYAEVIQTEESRHDDEVSAIAASQTKAMEELEKKVHTLRSQKVANERKVKQVNDELMRAKFELAECKQQISELELMNEDLKGEIRRQEGLVQREKTRADVWEKASRKQGGEIRHLETLKKVREHELHSIRAELPAKEVSIAKSEAKAKELGEELQRGFTEAGERERDMQALRARVKQLAKEKDGQATTIKALNSSLNTTATRIHDLLEQTKGQGILIHYEVV